MELGASANERIERLMMRLAALGEDADSIGKRHPTVSLIAFDARDTFVMVFRLMADSPEKRDALAAATEWLARVAARTYRAADLAVGRARSDLTRLAANARLLGVTALGA